MLEPMLIQEAASELAVEALDKDTLDQTGWVRHVCSAFGDYCDSFVQPGALPG